MNARRRSQCWGKQRYGTKKLAIDARKQWAERKGREALLWLVEPYECPFCHSWHLGRCKQSRKRYVEHVEEQMRLSREQDGAERLAAAPPRAIDRTRRTMTKGTPGC